MSQYFPKPYESLGGDINVTVNLSNYATKTDIKNISHVDTSRFAWKTNLASLKTEVDKLDIDKLVPVPVDLSKLSDVVKNDVVKKTEYDKLVAKVDNIDTSGFVLKTKDDTDKSILENKIPDTGGLVKKTDYNPKITEIEGKITDVTNLATKLPNVSGLATKAELNAIDRKVPNITGLINKSDIDKYINEIKNSYVTNSVLTSKLRKYVPYTACNLKVLLLENEITKYTPLNCYFVSKPYFGDDSYQSYLIFQPMFRYLKFGTNSQNISSWGSKGLSDEETKVVNGLYISVNYVNEKLHLKFEGSSLAQTKVTYTHKNIVHIYIVYKIGATTWNSYDPKLINGLFGAATLVKNSDINKFGYTGYRIGFDRGTTFSFPSGGFAHNVLFFSVDMSGSTHIDNRKTTY